MQSSRRRIFIPIVYIGVILLVLIFAVFAKSFSENFGGARISGRYAPFPLFASNSLEELTLSWNGLSLRFSRTMQPALRTFDSTDGRADIVFDGDARINLNPSADKAAQLALLPVAAPGAASLALAIPYSVSGIVDPSGGAGTLLWRRDGRSFQLTLPAGAHVDYAARSIDISPEGAPGQQGLRLAALEPEAIEQGISEPAMGAAPARRAPAPAAAALKLPDEKSLPTADQLSTLTSQYLDDAYAGWASGRRTADDSLWKMPDGSSVFTEDLGAAFLAESVQRGAFPSGIRLWNDALDARASRNPDAASAPLTSVYTGRVRDYVRRSLASDTAETQKIASLVTRSDSSVLATPDLELFLLTRAGPGPARDALTFLLSRDAGALDAAGSVGMLENLEQYVRFVGDDPSLPGKIRDLVQKKIIPALVPAEPGIFFMSAAGGRVDVKMSMRCGSLLLDAGTMLQDSRIASLGRGLISSGLALSSGAGFLPATLTVSSGKISAREGSLGPEAVYEFLPVDRRLPREVPLFRGLGAGAWVWTSAQVALLQGDSDTVRLGFTYPLKLPYHLVLRGLKPFTQIKLHGIPWHSDPSYASYSDGWSYDSNTRTLIMKITGRVEQEVVELSF